MTADRRRNVVALLVLAHLVVLAGFAVWDSWRGSGGAGAVRALTSTLFVSQVGLLSVWAGLGRGRRLDRLAAVGVACLAGVSILTASRSGGSGGIALVELLAVTSTLVLMMVLPIVVVLAVVRRLGWRLVLFSSGPPPTGAPLRFTVRHLLALTAVVAGFLSAGYYLRTWPQYGEYSLAGTAAYLAGNLIMIGVGMLSLLAAPLLAVWACLGVGRPGLRLLVAGIFCVALGSLPGYYSGGDVAEYAVFASATVLQLAIIAPSLLVFRAVGYRLVRHPTEVEAQEPVAGSD